MCHPWWNPPAKTALNACGAECAQDTPPGEHTHKAAAGFLRRRPSAAAPFVPLRGGGIATGPECAQTPEGRLNHHSLRTH
ncbi:hypothetical protein GCM10011374_36310 [Kocuria dechangensis]|uniref:Uncharacterized protein n=1 Tax=Kocuria dechangensis TaxID=1176249 RepID=A0A917H622_9MICC|nr:hypothetical protein GCM10011374_36310 [Kocuria dechangensis]